jgi:hypothetical protein
MKNVKAKVNYNDRSNCGERNKIEKIRNVGRKLWGKKNIPTPILFNAVENSVTIDVKVK